jgi:hypothetical protein
MEANNRCVDFSGKTAVGAQEPEFLVGSEGVEFTVTIDIRSDSIDLEIVNADSFAYPRCRSVGGPARKKGSGVPGRAIVERCFERRLEALDQSDASATSWSGRARITASRAPGRPGSGWPR